MKEYKFRLVRKRKNWFYLYKGKELVGYFDNAKLERFLKMKEHLWLPVSELKKRK